jgi:hypothetical protein
MPPSQTSLLVLPRRHARYTRRLPAPTRPVRESSGQSGENGVNGEICKLSHLVVGSILNGMGDEDASHVGEAEGSGLRCGSVDELG